MMGGEEEVYGFFVARVGLLELKIGNLNLELLMNHLGIQINRSSTDLCHIRGVSCGGVRNSFFSKTLQN